MPHTLRRPVSLLVAALFATTIVATLTAPVHQPPPGFPPADQRGRDAE